ncbi:MAG: hypothetical protein ACTSVI_09715 [Promethearchaeota archaeon]
MRLEGKIKLIGYLLVGIYAAFFIILGIMHWTLVGFNLDDDINYIGYITLSSLTLGTSVHLWSRLKDFEKGMSIRSLFFLMGTSFVMINLIFLYYIIDYLLGWAGLNSLSDIIDSIMPQLKFNLFDIESLKISMPLSSIVTFSFIMLGVGFFIYPLERYVKSRKPWFAISMFISLVSLPIISLFKDNVLLISIASTGIILFVLVNFIFMFYLYISLAVKSTGKMRSASTLVAFGLILMISVWILGVTSVFGQLTKSLIQFSVGMLSLTLFNAGFYIMRS